MIWHYIKGNILFFLPTVVKIVKFIEIIAINETKFDIIVITNGGELWGEKWNYTVMNVRCFRCIR